MKYNEHSFWFYLVFAFIIFSIFDKINHGAFFVEIRFNLAFALVAACIFNFVENAIRLYNVIGTAMLSISAKNIQQKKESDNVNE